MLWILILSILLAGLTTYLLLLLKDIRHISSELNFLLTHKSRLRLSSELRNPALLRLITQINEQLERSHQMEVRILDEQKRSKEILAGLSHDIRTPLTSLGGYLELLAETDDPAKRQYYFSIMEERIQSLTSILEDLFTYAKLQQDGYTLDHSPLDLHEIFLHELFSYYEEFKSRGIEPELDLPDGPSLISGDDHALRRVLQNILKNMLKHGQGDIAIRLREEADSSVALSFSNAVNPNEEIDPERLFQQFYTGDPSRQNGSHGLGLPIARRLVEEMGGSITATATDGRFSLELHFPAAAPFPETVARQNESPLRSRAPDK